MTERRNRSNRETGTTGKLGSTGSTRRQDPPADNARAYPELSRHLRGSDSVYQPDSADWLRKPASRTRPNDRGNGSGNGGKGSSNRTSQAPGQAPPPRVPPRNRRKVEEAPKPHGNSAIRIALILVVTVAVFGFIVQQFTTGGEPPLPTPTEAPIFDPPVGTPDGIVMPTATATATSLPTETSTPKPTSTPRPTSTPDARFKGKIVCLDPGHGGSDRGATRKADNGAPEMEEAVYTLMWARALKIRLESDGFTVVLTRDADVDVNAAGKDVNKDGETEKNQKDATEKRRAKMVDELQARINYCNEQDASVLVSLHINYFDDASAIGYETWFSGVRNDADASKLFAEIMEREIGRQYAAAGYTTISRGANNDSDADADLGKGTFDHYLVIGPAQQNKVTPSEMPGIIVESGFMSNDKEAAFMASPEGRNAIITAYEQAIVKYFIYISENFVYGAK